MRYGNDHRLIDELIDPRGTWGNLLAFDGCTLIASLSHILLRIGLEPFDEEFFALTRHKSLHA